MVTSAHTGENSGYISGSLHSCYLCLSTAVTYCEVHVQFNYSRYILASFRHSHSIITSIITVHYNMPRIDMMVIFNCMAVLHCLSLTVIILNPFVPEFIIPAEPLNAR